MSLYPHKLEGIINITFVGFALTLAEDIGILDVLMNAEGPLTSDQIAEKKELKERYVREILASLTTAEVILAEVRGGTLVYYLKTEEKAALRTFIESAGLGFLQQMMNNYESVLKCVPQDGPEGMKYPDVFIDCLGDYHQSCASDYTEQFFRFGGDLREKLETGIEVLEVACLEARFTAMVARRFTNCTFTATDNDASYRESQTEYASDQPNLKLITYDLYTPHSVPTQQYDWIYCINGLHDVPSQHVVLENIKDLLKPDGVFMLLEKRAERNSLLDRGELPVAGFYAMSTFFNVPECFYRDPYGNALGLCWGKEAELDIYLAGMCTHATVYIDNDILFVCRLYPL